LHIFESKIETIIFFLHNNLVRLVYIKCFYSYISFR